MFCKSLPKLFTQEGLHQFKVVSSSIALGAVAGAGYSYYVIQKNCFIHSGNRGSCRCYCRYRLYYLKIFVEEWKKNKNNKKGQVNQSLVPPPRTGPFNPACRPNRSLMSKVVLFFCTKIIHYKTGLLKSCL